MCSDQDAGHYLLEEAGIPDRGQLPHFFLDGDAEHDPEVKRLQNMLQQKAPAIRELLWRLLRSDSEMPDYMDRIYRRLRGALLAGANLDEAAVWRRAVSLVHEERRRFWRRRNGSISPTRPALPDPTSLQFFIALVRGDQLEAFRSCLDEWTREAFDLKYSSPFELSGEDLSKRFGISRDSFYQRWKRGMDAGRAEYLLRHGDPMA
jgi:hypothetical protein